MILIVKDDAWKKIFDLADVSEFEFIIRYCNVLWPLFLHEFVPVLEKLLSSVFAAYPRGPFFKLYHGVFKKGNL